MISDVKMQTDLEDCSWEDVYSLYGVSSDFHMGKKKAISPKGSCSQEVLDCL